MILHRNALWLVPLVCLITFPIWKIPVGNFLTPRTSEESSHNQEKEEGYNFSMNSVIIRQIEAARETAVIHAVTASSSEERPNEYILEQIDGDIIDNQDNTTNIVADSGIYNVETKLLKLTGNVIITNRADDSTMKTSLLFYDGNERRVTSPKKTRLLGKGITVDGSSFEHDMNTGIYTVGGRVHCVLQGE